MKYVRVLLLLIPGLLLLPTAYAQPTTTVSISGKVSTTALGPLITVTVQANAQGSPSSLSGNGIDTASEGGVLLKLIGLPGQCNEQLTHGVISPDGTKVVLQGIVVKSFDGAFNGTPVLIFAKTAGAITFDFGPFVFTGTGTVIINNA